MNHQKIIEVTRAPYNKEEHPRRLITNFFTVHKIPYEQICEFCHLNRLQKKLLKVVNPKSILTVDIK